MEHQGKHKILMLTHKTVGTNDNFLDLYGEYIKHFGFTFDRPNSAKLLKNLFVKKWLEGFCVCNELTVYGFCIFSKTYSPGACAMAYSIEDLFVSSTKRGIGIGESLIRYLCDYAKICGVGQIYVNSDLNDKQLMRFYERNGFKDTSVNILRKNIG